MHPLLLRLVGALPGAWITAISRSQWRHPALQRAFRFCARRFQCQEGVIAKGAGRGLRFNPGTANAGYLLGTSEPAVQHLMQELLRPGFRVYDIGANVGFFTTLAARLVGPGGEVVAFDPLDANITLLRRNLALNAFTHVGIRQEAVGDRDGEMDFLVAAESTLGRLASVANEAPELVDRRQVPVVRLDSLVSAGVLKPPDFVKVDVEGAEAAVLRGAETLLRTARPLLLIELHGTNAAMAEALAAQGYEGADCESRQPIREAAWNAHILAIPTERPDRVLLRERARPPGAGR